MATITYQSYLGIADSSETNKYAKLIDIKDYPDLGGDPELVETTTLSDSMQTNIMGIQSLDSLAFTCNYDSESYRKIKALHDANKDFKLAVIFIEGGKTVAYGWDGQIDVYITSGDTNAVREMSVSSVASTVIKEITDIEFDVDNTWSNSSGTISVPASV